MRRVLTLVAAAALLAVPACGGDDDDDAAAPSAGPTATVTVPSTPTPSAPASTAPGSTMPRQQWPTDPVSVPFVGRVPPVPTLSAIRIGAHPEGGYDRVAFNFDRLPGYVVKYQSSIVYDGSGKPVDLPGDAFVQLVFNPAQAHDDEGRSTLAHAPVEPVGVNLPALSSYVLNGDFEGYVSVALGLPEKVGFRVGHLRSSSGQSVVYIDLARP
jgi:hypothetical protein